MQKPILAAEPFTPAADTGRETRVRVAILTLDTHIASAADQAEARLQQSMPGLSLRIHAASEWDSQPGSLAAAKEDLEKADIIVATMMFMDEHLRAILPVLEARRDACDAMAVCVSAGEAVRLTKLGGLSFSGETKGPLALLKRLRGTKKNASSGAGQMAMLRRLPKILRFIPGKAQDLRAYFLTMQYWLSGSEQNIEQMVRFLISRYAGGDREALRAFAEPQDPVEYPETGCYHPDMRGKVSADRRDLPNGASGPLGLSLSKRLTVGLLLMRSYLLAGDADHYNAVIRGFEAKGIRVIPAFAAGLDARPAVERFFLDGDRPMVDAVVSLTGFSLVGGPAYNDAEAAAAMLEQLGVPYLAAHALEFQTLDQWAEGERGLTPIEATMMVAIPEIDGATGPMIFGGRTAVGGRRMRAAEDRVALLVARTERLMRLRHTPATERRIAVTLFNFPPNAGATGTAAFLDVFASLHNTLRALRDAGYETGALPETADALREAVTGGNAERFGADGNVFARIAVDDYVSTEPHLAEIEAQWGPAPGKHQTDGRSLYVLGLRFGNVFVGLQPGFGYEGDPMRLLFERGFAPTHAFSAYYRWLREDFDAHAVLHFGTHGALEFMPGKQTGLSAACWPERLIG
ncbi:MAG: cobaltochelatase subunit CobN, partial [Pseudomonadota bacterium]